MPEDVEFGKGNPLETSKKFVDSKCPKCKGKGRRETDTMDTFFDSSWYYLRYCDNKNRSKPFDANKIECWMPVNQYIGGAEHACMHLIYARFFTKALRDLGFLKFDEPFIRLFNQGMLHGPDGEKMSKSKGNVVLPEGVSKKYGIDSARLFLVSVASPDKDIDWSDNGSQGSYKFINRVIDYCSNVKIGKSNEKIEHKINYAIREITKRIEVMEYNVSVIKLRELFDSISQEKEIARKDLESFVKLISVFCPHVAEEMWEKIGGKGFVSLAEWPKCDEKKINEKIEQAEQNVEKTVGDIMNILKIVKEKEGKADEGIKKIYLYVIPNEIDNYNSDVLSRRVGKEIKVYKVNDKDKYDPEGKAGKAKPGKPGIYVE